jgi:hypothetical protein
MAVTEKNRPFCGGLDDRDEIFVVDVHKDQLIYLEDPQPVIPQRKNHKRGRKTSRYQAQTQPIRVDNWKEAHPKEAWQRYQEEIPLLSCNDIETLLRIFLPRRDVEPDEVVRQMEKRHRKRQASIDNAFNKQLAFSTG